MGAFAAAILGGAGAVHANITESFDRADNATVGNNWVEKTPAAFSIQGNGLLKAATGSGYTDNIVYRPASENVLDVESSVEMRLTAANPGYPQLLVRVQTDTVTAGGWLDGYMLYMDGSNAGAVLGRQRGGAFVTTLADIPLNPALNTTDTYRLRLRATGTTPVVVSAWVERRTGTNPTTWAIIGQASVNDSAGDRIASAGSVGVSGYIENAYRFDNFVRTNVVGPPPPTIPQITSLSPMSATIGASSTNVTITGTGFTTSSVARWNGSNRTTTFLSSTQVRMTVPSGDLSSDRMGAITVVNGSEVSPVPLTFFVVPATDVVFFDGFNRGPTTTVGNGWVEKLPSAFEITASGVLFANDTYPYEFHDAIVYRPLSEARQDVEAGVEFLRAAGARFPQVHSRIQGNSINSPNTLESYILYVEDGIQPNGLALAVQPPVFGTGECIIGYTVFPTLPAVGTRYRIRLQTRGTNPVQLTGIMERFDGGAWQPFVTVAVNHNAATQESGIFCPYPNVPAPITNAGTVGVAKWYDRTDGYDNFYWRGIAQGNVPQLNTIAPSNVVVGSGAFTLNLSGFNFTSNSTVRWNGSNRTTTLVSSTQLSAAIPASDVASTGSATVTVFNSGTGGGTSESRTINITSAPSVNFSDNFNRANSATLGNGWVEKTADAFSIETNRLRKLSFNTNYLNSVVYRPSGEAVLDSEVSAEMRMLNSNIGWPQLFSRIQLDTAPIMERLDGYIFFLDGDASTAVLGRQRGTSYLTELSRVTLSQPVNLTDTYRLRMRTTGTNPVQLSAWVERWNGTAWVSIGTATASDNSIERIVNPGVGGLGGYIENYYSYDNFTVLRLD